MAGLETQRAIVPIVLQDPDGHVVRLLGTGFYVGSRPAVVTARHVLEGINPSVGTAALAYLQPDGVVRLAQINNHLSSKEFDIAVFAAGSVPGAVSLRMTRSKVPPNQDVLTYEFSWTRIERRDDQRIVHFSPFTHKGNVLRHYMSDFPEDRPTAVFDTSFPALQGASGAPVVRANDFVVVGMLVANHERHLAPAQVLRIDSDDREAEVVTYFLPTGKALEGRLLVDYLESIGCDPTVVG